jgi:hypothetical protein
MKAIEIFGEAKQPTPANNPVAKNANKAIGGGASGTHKNPKRAESIPRKEKHKKAPELAEATNRHFGPNGAGTELARQTRQAEIDRKFNTPDQLQKEKDYRDYRAGIKKAKVVAKKNKGVAEGSGDLKSELAAVYSELAPKIERHRDSFGAGQLYDALEAVADKHGAGKQLAIMMRSARNSAHMEYDTNPGGFENWFWFLPFATDDEQGVAEAKRADRPLPKTDLQVGDRVVADLRKEKDYPGGHQFRSGFVTRIGEKGVHIEPDERGPHEWHPYKIVKKLGEGKSAREKWTAASNAREKAHNEREAEQAKLPAEKRLGSAVDALKKHLDSKVTEEQFCEDCGGSLAEHGKASRALCISSKPDSELGASNLASCKSQGLRAREGKKSHKLGKSPKSRVKVGGHKIKGKEYGGPLPDWS